MSSPEHLIEYMVLEYISSLDFISIRLANVKSSSDLTYIGNNIVPEAVQTFGYKTLLKYESISNPYWKALSTSDIFLIKRDSLFGENVTFDIDLYRKKVASIKEGSKNHKIIAELIEDFGREGFQRALGTVASTHKWDKLREHSQVEEIDESPSELRRHISLSQREISELVNEMSRIKLFVDDLALSQEDKAQALSLVEAAICLAESPDPPWKLIREILYLIAAISTSLGFVVAIAEKIF